jgi:hypothetical protein
MCIVRTAHDVTRPSDHPATEYPCDHFQSSAPGLLLLPRSSSLPAMPHLSPAHYETSKHDSPHEIKIKVKSSKCLVFEFKPHQVNDSSQLHQGTDHLVSQSTYVFALDLHECDVVYGCYVVYGCEVMNRFHPCYKYCDV